MSEPVEERESSPWIRYAAPLVVFASGLAFSVFVQSSGVGSRLGLLPTPLALWLLPAVALSVLVGVRLSSGATDRTSDLLLLWVFSFPIALHVLHLLFSLGVLGGLDRAVALVVMSLDLGFAGILPQLPLGSPFGLRFSRTLASEGRWRRAHRNLGVGFLVAAALALGSIWLPPKLALAVYLGGPVLAFGFGLVSSFLPDREHSGPRERPTDEHEIPGDDESSP